jgi:hypothetical protein
MKQRALEPAVWGMASVWGVAEAGLGGVMHGLKLPFTGLTVGGVAATVLIVLAAFQRGLYHRDRTPTRSTQLLLQVTATVLLIKALASPHSPITAYVAVSFQGLLAAALFRVIPSFRLAALLFAVLAMTESATQKLLMMWLVYGHAFFDALDALTGYASGQISALHLPSPISSSAVLSLFLGIYAGWGAVLGWTVGRWPDRAHRLAPELLANWHDAAADPAASTPRKRRPRYLALAAILAVLAAAGATWNELGWLLVRTIAITAVLFGVIGPWTRRFIERRASAGRRNQALHLIASFDQQRRRFTWAFRSARPHVHRWQLPLAGLERWVLLNLVAPPEPPESAQHAD